MGEHDARPTVSPLRGRRRPSRRRGAPGAHPDAPLGRRAVALGRGRRLRRHRPRRARPRGSRRAGRPRSRRVQVRRRRPSRRQRCRRAMGRRRLPRHRAHPRLPQRRPRRARRRRGPDPTLAARHAPFVALRDIHEGARGARTRRRPKHGVHEPYARAASESSPRRGGARVGPRFSSPSATTSPSATSPPPRARDDAPTRDGISSLARLASSDVDDAAGSEDAGSTERVPGRTARVGRARNTKYLAFRRGRRAIDSRPNAVRFGSPRAGFARRVARGVRAESSRVRAGAVVSRRPSSDSPEQLGYRLVDARACAFRRRGGGPPRAIPPRSTEILAAWRRVCCCAISRRALEGVHVGDMCARPFSAMHNGRALSFGRARCCSDHMWSARRKIAAGDAATCWGLLSDLRAAYGDARRRSHREEHSRPDRVGRAPRAGRGKSRRRRRRRPGRRARGVALRAGPPFEARLKPSGSDDSASRRKIDVGQAGILLQAP